MRIFNHQALLRDIWENRLSEKDQFKSFIFSAFLTPFPGFLYLFVLALAVIRRSLDSIPLAILCFIALTSLIVGGMIKAYRENGGNQGKNLLGKIISFHVPLSIQLQFFFFSGALAITLWDKGNVVSKVLNYFELNTKDRIPKIEYQR